MPDYFLWGSKLGEFTEPTKVYWICDVCQRQVNVNIPALLKRLGPDFDLKNRRPPCRIPNCPGIVTFYARRGSAWPIALTTPGAERDWLSKCQAHHARIEALGYGWDTGRWVHPKRMRNRKTPRP